MSSAASGIDPGTTVRPAFARHPSTVRHRLALIALIGLYFAISLNNLALLPPIHEDESWQASVGWKLATEGVFGSDMFAGLGRADERYYGFLPMHPLLLAATFKIAGLGLLQLRAETVLLGAVVLFLTYAVGKRLWSPEVGLVAVAFLLFVRMDAVTPWTLSGILFLDGPRIGRYDITVPVFELASLFVFLVARDRGRASAGATLWYACAGLLAAGAALSHVYGLFWLVVLLVLAIWDGARPQHIAALSIAFLIPCLAYVVYVLRDLPAWRTQTEIYAPRFRLLAPEWYADNVTRERFRYGPGREQGIGWLLRPGLWLGFGAVAAGLWMLAKRTRTDFSARVIVAAGIMLPLLFALLVTAKTRNYKMAFLPMWAIAAAWAACEVWRRSHSSRLIRTALAVFAVIVVAEGLVRARAISAAAATTTTYRDFISRVHEHVRPGERVLGLHAYWIGFEDTDFHSWYVPTALFKPGATDRAAAPLVIGTDPEVVLVDRRMRAFLDRAALGDARAQAVASWLEPWSVDAVVDDPTYGRMEIYRKR